MDADPGPAAPRTYPGWGRSLVVLALAVVAGTAGSAFLAWTGRGSLEHLALVAMTGIWGALPLALLACLTGGLGLLLPRRSSRRFFAHVALVSLALAIALGLVSSSYLPGRILNERDVAEAQRYCQDLVPAMERALGAQGSYPLGLDEIDGERGELPRLLRPSFFVSDGERYWFEFDDPSSLGRRWIFRSGERRWRTAD